MGSNTTQPWPLPFSKTIVEPSADAPTTPPACAEATTGEAGVEELLQSLRSDAIDARTEPMVDPAAAARKADAVADALRGLREAQDRAWAPTPSAAAASDGARYAAHYGVHAIPRAATPDDPAAKVILNVTLPPAEPRRPPSTPDAAEAVARQARTHVALPRVAETVVRRSAVAAPSAAKAPSRMLVALMTLGIVLVGGGGIVWAGFRMWSSPPAPAAVAAPAMPSPAAEPRPAEPPPELTAAAAPAPTINDDVAPGSGSGSGAAAPIAVTSAVASVASVASVRRGAPRSSAGRPATAALPPAAAAAPAKPAPPAPRAPASTSRPVQETFE